MQCANCGTENPGEAQFCMSCGAAVELACPNCATRLPGGARFCFSCGHEIEAGSTEGMAGQTTASVADELASVLEGLPEARGERRRITMMFCDVVGSTEAAERLEPEQWAAVMRGAFDRFIAPVERYGGSVARLLGDAILAYFGAPEAHEDDPQRALLAALAIVESSREYSGEVADQYGVELQVRIGINTGLVVVGDVGSDLYGEYAALGDAANVAARMEQTADPGTIRVGESTHRLVAPLFEFASVGEVAVKGKGDPIAAYEVLGAMEQPGRLRGIEGLASAVVGRTEEQQLLSGALQGLREGRGGVVSLIGEAGLGKTRLTADLHGEAATPSEVRWIEGQSHSYETSTPFTPFIDLLNECFGINQADDDATRYSKLSARVERLTGPAEVIDRAFLASILGIELPPKDAEQFEHLQPPQIREGAFEAMKAFLTELARDMPLVVVLEDIHWADPVSIELVKELVALTERAQVLLMLQFRPRRDEPAWEVHQLAERHYPHRYQAIYLQPLEDAAARELIANLLAVEGLTPTVREAILDKAEGNPFFVEEVVRSLLDEGTIVPRGEHFVATAEITEIAVPETLAAVIATRLDSLDTTSKRLLQTASVIGREFDEEMVLLLLDVGSNVDAALSDLLRRELLVEQQRGPVRSFAFKHALTMDTAYESLLVSVRRDLHAVVGKLLEERDPTRVADLSRHFLAAEEPRRALPYLVAAADQAFRAFSIPEAEEQYQKALELWSDGDDVDLKRRAFEGLGGALTFGGDPEAALVTFGEMFRFGESLGHAPTQVSALNKQAFTTAFVVGDFQEAEGLLLEAKQLAEDGNDLMGLAEFHVHYCGLNTAQGRLEIAAEHLLDAEKVGVQIESTFHRIFGMTHYANTLIFLTRFEEAENAIQEALSEAEAEGERLFIAELNGVAIPLYELAAGRLVDGLDGGLEALALAEEIGALLEISNIASIAGLLALWLGRYEDAIRYLERTGEAAERIGYTSGVGMGLAGLAAAKRDIFGQGASGEIRELVAEAQPALVAPLGASHAPLAFAAMGHGAVVDGDPELAAEYLDAGLSISSPIKNFAKPDLLLCAAKIAVASGDLETAAARAGEAADFAAEHRLRWIQPKARAAGWLIDALRGRVDPGDDGAEEAATEAAEMRLLPDALAIHREAARVFDSLGKNSSAAAHRASTADVAAEIASLFESPELRKAYLRTNAVPGTAS